MIICKIAYKLKKSLTLVDKISTNFHYIFYQRDFIISSEKKIIDFNNSIPIGLMQILMELKKDSPLDTLTLYFTIIDVNIFI